MQANLDLVQLRLAHDAGQAEQQTVVIGAWVVEPLAVGDQHAEQRAQLQKLMPVVVVACQARGVQAQHQPRLAQPDLGDQPLKAVPVVAGSSRLPEIVVDHLDPILGPPEQDRSINEPVLQLGALLVLADLSGGGLPHVDVGQLRSMRCRDRVFGDRRRVQHDPPPSAPERRSLSTSTEAAEPTAVPDAAEPPAPSPAIASAQAPSAAPEGPSRKSC